MCNRAVVAVVAALALAGCGRAISGPMLPAISSHAVLPEIRARLRCNGHIDDAPALQAAIDSLGDRGGIVRLPRGTCAIGETIAVTQSNVMLLGMGAGYPAESSARPATALLWIGARNGTLLKFGNRRKPVQAGGMDAIALQSNDGLAGYGLLLAGEQGGYFANFTADAFSIAAIDLGWTKFNQMHNHFENYNLHNEQNAGAGIIIGTKTRSSGYYNQFDNGYIQITNGIGIEQLKSDGNFFQNTHETMVPGGKGTGVLFGCGATSNHFYWLTAAYSNRYNGVVVYGVGSCGSGKQAFADSIDLYDRNNNGGAIPLVGAGTAFHCTTDTGTRCRVHYGKPRNAP